MADRQARAEKVSLPGGMAEPDTPPIRDGMEYVVSLDARERSATADFNLLRACLALGGSGEPRLPARIRLERAVGHDLARRLLDLVLRSARR